VEVEGRVLVGGFAAVWQPGALGNNVGSRLCLDLWEEEEEARRCGQLLRLWFLEI